MRLSRRFSHIYLEEAAERYPLTEKLLARFSKAERVRVDSYKHFFARPRQNFVLQKRSPKLILAVKRGGYLYAGSDRAQAFGYRNFYYNSLILNCLYNCDYCYLQGIYPSANMVIFVNLEDYFEATRGALAGRPDPSTPLYLAISYDTDLLAFESVVPYTREWIEFSRGEPDLLIEARTKSANYARIADLAPHGRTILAWTLSPSEVARKYERTAPSLERRLAAAARAADDGWKVRLCFDPVLLIEGWRRIYKRCVEETFARIDPSKVHDLSVGGFRMNREQFKRIQKFREDSDILYYPYSRRENTVAYSRAETDQIIDWMTELLRNYLPAERIVTWR